MRKPRKENLLALLVVVLIIAWFVWMNQPATYSPNPYSLPPLVGKARGLDYATGRWIYYGQDDREPTTEENYKDSLRIHRIKSRTIREREIEEYLEREYPDLEEYWGEN